MAELGNRRGFRPGQFWDEMAAIYGLENLQGFGCNWQGNPMSYAIGLKNGEIQNCNLRIILPDEGWETVTGETDCLEVLYDEIYASGNLL